MIIIWHHVVMIAIIVHDYLAYLCFGWGPNLQNQQKHNKQLIEIDANDAEPTSQGGMGVIISQSYVTWQSYDLMYKIVRFQSGPKCHIRL